MSFCETYRAAPAGVASPGSTSSAEAARSLPFVSIRSTEPRPATAPAEAAYAPLAYVATARWLAGIEPGVTES